MEIGKATSVYQTQEVKGTKEKEKVESYYSIHYCVDDCAKYISYLSYRKKIFL